MVGSSMVTTQPSRSSNMITVIKREGHGYTITGDIERYLRKRGFIPSDKSPRIWHNLTFCCVSLENYGNEWLLVTSEKTAIKLDLITPVKNNTTFKLSNWRMVP